MVDKRTTELWPAFVLVGMVFLVPVMTGEVLGLTKATVKAYLNYPNIPLNPVLVDSRLDKGDWVVEPHCENVCGWQTSGEKSRGGAELGYVIVKYYNPLEPQPHQAKNTTTHQPVAKVVLPVAKVVFRWSNPAITSRESNTCEAVVLEKSVLQSNVEARCSIGQGASVTAEYYVNYTPP
jgi:hypothetical protein